MYEELDSFERALAHFGTRVDIICAMKWGEELMLKLLTKILNRNSNHSKEFASHSKKTKICDKCGVEKPLDINHYQVVKYFRDGFSYYCNDCSKPKLRD